MSYLKQVANLWYAQDNSDSYPQWGGKSVTAYKLRDEGIVWLVGVVVCLLTVPRIQLSLSADNGWSYNTIQYHRVFPIRCNFHDCKVLVSHDSKVPLSFVFLMPGLQAYTCYSKCRPTDHYLYVNITDVNTVLKHLLYSNWTITHIFVFVIHCMRYDLTLFVRFTLNVARNTRYHIPKSCFVKRENHNLFNGAVTHLLT